MITKAERQAKIEEGYDWIYEQDECRIQIAEAMFQKCHIVSATDGSISFRDGEGRYWQSTEPYTIVVTKEINADDEGDEGNVD